MKSLRFSTLFLLLAGLGILFSCTKDTALTEEENLNPRNVTSITIPGGDDFPGGPAGGTTIVDLAIATPDLATLVDAVVRADLVGLLSSEGPFTVFAPTNDAFAQFLADNGFSSLDDVPVDVLTTVLATHVLAGEFFAADLNNGYFNTLADGAGLSNKLDIYINTDNGVVINGGPSVIAADVDASNGVVHVIDQVINPSDLIALAAGNPEFSSLVAALTRPDLSIDFVDVLSGSGPFTVLAPTNDAFQDLLDSNPAWNDLNDIPADLLEAVLLYHVSTQGNLTSNFFLRRPVVNTLLDGQTYQPSVSFGGGLTINIQANSNSATVIAADVQGINGVAHAIDAVILP